MTLQLNHNVTIQSVLYVQYTCLNIHVDVELNFNHQIALLYNKAARQINALLRYQVYIVTFHVLLYNMAFLHC